jgi:hypothetical protein
MKIYTKKNIITAVFTVFTVTLFLMSFDFFPGGYVGTTKKDGGILGCVCHGEFPNDTISVGIQGPDSVAAGETATYTVFVSHGPAMIGGFNVANHRSNGADTLYLTPVPGDTMVRTQTGELTHRHPRSFTNDTVKWQFNYTASSVTGYDTLFATGNSTNDDTTSENDKWNWSPNKVVRIYVPIGIINLSTIASEFSLSQNYPNPFNPVTNIHFSVAKSSDVKIRVYDILGNVVAEPVSGNMKQGSYSVDFNASGFASGAYFYSLIINGERVSTKKMLLVK